MKNLATKRILLGVTGSIAAYKAAELVRGLREVGAEIQVVMTHSANEFIAPRTFQALSGYPVHQDLLDNDAQAGMGHIELARWADAILIAPASADFIARLAQGRANDLLSAVCLASQAPIAIAPAMNAQMWQNPATQDNISILINRGINQLGPDAGEQACGEVGLGRMLEPEAIIAHITKIFANNILTGKTVLVTAGPTQEPIDPVRYLSNHSSGKMGYSIAQAAQEAGAQVKLVSGPVALPHPSRVECFNVQTAQQMLHCVQQHMEDVDIFVASAAVADYRPVFPQTGKLKKTPAELNLQLEPTADILTNIKTQFPPCVLCRVCG